MSDTKNINAMVSTSVGHPFIMPSEGPTQFGNVGMSIDFDYFVADFNWSNDPKDRSFITNIGPRIGIATIAHPAGSGESSIVQAKIGIAFDQCTNGPYCFNFAPSFKYTNVPDGHLLGAGIDLSAYWYFSDNGALGIVLNYTFGESVPKYKADQITILEPALSLRFDL